MPSTFFGLTIASSGLTAYQAASNTTANNISNVQTKGYSRQITNRVAAAALRVNAKYGTAGTGVEAVSITQERNLYYDTKYWKNNASFGMYETRYNFSKQIENYFIDDGKASNGFSSILSTMFNFLDSLKGNSGDSNVRKQFIGGAQTLATYFNTTAKGLADIQEDTNTQVRATVDNINSLAERIAILNKQINVLEIQGGMANELRDDRALLIDELSKIVPTTVEEVKVQNSNYPDAYTGATEYIVSINGQTLVYGKEYEQLECRARETKVNQTDVDGLYDIVWKTTGNTFNAGASSNIGSLKALLDIRDGNNGEYFHGTVEQVTVGQDADGNRVSEIRLSAPSMKTESELTIADESRLLINNKYYNYTSFKASYDADGNIEYYTFTLDEEVTDASELNKMQGAEAAVGTFIDHMGVPYYQAQMNEFLRNFCKRFNEIEQTGNYIDSNGDLQKMGSFWMAWDSVKHEEYDMTENNALTSTSNSYYRLTAANIAVARASVKDPLIFSTSVDPLNGQDKFDVAEQLLELKSNEVMYRGCGASEFLECMYSDVSVDTEEAKLFTQNYEDINNTIENQRLSVKGVDEDDEAMDLLKFRNAYNLCSQVVSVLTEMYDRLILETGV